jgi:hypothetical protein
MSRYRITDADRPFALEFRDNLERGNWHHSPGLQRVLNVMRGGPRAGKLVLVEQVPFRRWRLGRLAGERGAAVEVVAGYEFTDLKDAEWSVFRLRWREHTEQELEP